MSAKTAGKGLIAPTMTLHVYRVNRDGEVVEDQGAVNVVPSDEPLMSGAWPPCRCPRHRDAR
ncbi:hypothetical protein [Streptomyces sp. GESEQ-35]|uniref:hypothetical protein n=1 Tax=Streptomyces sp. GESEQ-35 TaxID=2812657 RepID=UPI001B3252B5|nr:hypothetical protein [Streptomyces sp. GESEQ-35]